jgi:hypothetical protein
MFNPAVPPSPPLPSATELETVNALLKLLADPAATTARLEKFRSDVEANRAAAEKGLRDLHATLSDGLRRREADLDRRDREHEAERDGWTRTAADEKAALALDRAKVEEGLRLLEQFVRDLNVSLPRAKQLLQMTRVMEGA